MAEETRFWPSDIGDDLPVAPIRILKEAAVELERATKGALEAQAFPRQAILGNRLECTLSVTAKAIGLKYDLGSISYEATDLYPVRILFGEPYVQANNEAELRKCLADVLARPDIVRSIKALLAQSA